MAWTAPKTYVAGSVHTAAELNTYERDNFIAVQSGTIALAQVTFDGSATPPAASASGEAVVYYDTVDDTLKVSLNGGGFESLGGFNPLNSAILAGGTMFGFRF